MSVRVLSLVWDGYPDGGSGLLALLALADWSDDDGRCWPSINAVAKKTRLSRSQTQRTVHALIESGFVSVTGNETGGAPGSTRQYRINLKALTGSTHATPTGSAHATGSVGATGSANAHEGSHPCTQTGSTHATQTVSEPSITVNKVESPEWTNFWKAYPRKEAKQKALTAWRKISPNETLCEKIMTSLIRQKASEQWIKDSGTFVPHPATWLNGRRWEDQVDEETRGLVL